MTYWTDFSNCYSISISTPCLSLNRFAVTDETDYTLTGAGTAVGGSLLCVCDCQSV